MSKSALYHSMYIEKDGEYVSLTNEASTFCEKWIKPIHSESWDWTKRDFSKPNNDPPIEEARAIRDLI